MAEVQDIIEDRGAAIKYPPPYRPDLNPIEQIFATFKALLQKAAERTYDKLWRIMGKLLEHVHADECLNFFNIQGMFLHNK